MPFSLQENGLKMVSDEHHKLPNENSDDQSVKVISGFNQVSSQFNDLIKSTIM